MVNTIYFMEDVAISDSFLHIIINHIVVILAIIRCLYTSAEY